MVHTRQLPASSVDTVPHVVMKIDIEGTELEVVPDLVMSGAISHVDEIHLDWTAGDPYVDNDKNAELAAAMQVVSELAVQQELHHQCMIEAVDDETFGGFNGYLPEC